MRRRSRSRRILRWMGLIASVLLLSAWAAIPSRAFTLPGSPRLRFVKGLDMPRRVYPIVHIDGPEYRFGCINVTVLEYVAVPYRLLVVPGAIPTAVLWYRDRRPPRGHCQHCGYNLTGNQSGTCPECGEAVA